MIQFNNVLAAILGLLLCHNLIEARLGSNFIFTTDFDAESSPTEARNIRASARYHWYEANKAQNQMLKAENDDDIDGYEKWLEVMREEDEKWQAKVAEYDQLRDILEAKIRTGELEIEGFNQRYEKGAVASIVDHLTFRART